MFKFGSVGMGRALKHSETDSPICKVDAGPGPKHIHIILLEDTNRTSEDKETAAEFMKMLNRREEPEKKSEK